ncbi:MAG: hypothetical protein A2921_00835 [Candidatus Magasanikbacteria bacterium RIFCSPLOWO2_01_FULL_43_20b]|uniref:Uncharacterized protein n=1 Tax=Candidatus Magasanikbacteria bacterium RIFCSPLOWO2_12_FULL_43_12 TaxID=1798692 RepID=A0A1F6MVV3_9BACT|nr:MAG: hypothetical protein A3I93_00555 [Candidatus Magasanikbacteria bacterium RIFCSPLOWO2_02_FULL_43_22]OGH72824.1 MAG: hypothetical protein A2921_00835 [Candidatus Magasanikbacteria bacterium RIFCSPLOWO2_01_FULL_43_20b]OGH75620.1 MAG: hypothetical protein A3G00_03950 [Candidatus Magasanikbacteria bacterium RIFCSPLOWO2_12_FULL_43_12]
MTMPMIAAVIVSSALLSCSEFPRASIQVKPPYNIKAKNKTPTRDRPVPSTLPMRTGSCPGAVLSNLAAPAVSSRPYPAKTMVGAKMKRQMRRENKNFLKDILLIFNFQFLIFKQFLMN